MIVVDPHLSPRRLLPAVQRLFDLSAAKIRALEKRWKPEDGSPVFTVNGLYRARGWTEWTQGFQFGSALLQYDATGDKAFLDLGRSRTLERMTPHLTHMGVHDHGFNNVSTYGTLWRLDREGRSEAPEAERRLYAMALSVSAAVQARRFTRTAEGGFIHSFNGAHSLFVDTIRSLRSLALGHILGHHLLEEQDQETSLLERLIFHARATARYSVYFGQGRDVWDVRGRVAHESLFNPANGTYRGPSTQQGYSPFSTWTRGLGWAILGFAEELELVSALPEEELAPFGGREELTGFLLEAARATADFYVEESPTDGVPYWDTGAPGLLALGDWSRRAADPYNDSEPVDSSAAAIACQGLLRLGAWLARAGGETAAAARYTAAGLTTLATLLDDAGPYLATDAAHEGLLLHAVYHRPNGWDHVPEGAAIPHGEACLWGDYHLREAALLVQRMASGEWLAFFGPTP